MKGTLLATIFFISLAHLALAQDPGPTGPSFGSTCTITGDLNWTNPVTTNTILIFAKANTAVSIGTPTNNISTYTASNAFGSGTQYQNDASAFCVYSGIGNNVSLTGLTAGVTYHFIIFNANATVYSMPIAFSGATLTTPGNASGLSGTPGGGDASVSWTNPSTCFDEIMIVAKQSSSVSGTPSGDGTGYTANLAFSSGTAFGGGFVVYKGSSSSQTITGLLNGQDYYVKLFTRKGTAWSAGVETNFTLCAPTNVTGLRVSDTNTTATLNWTDGSCFDEIMIVAKQGSAITAAPSGNGSAYTANSLSFTDGANSSFDGGKVVFKGGSGQSPKTITNLTAATVYYFKIFGRKGTTWSSGAPIRTSTGSPFIVALDPVDGNSNVPSNKVFTITFSENIFIATGGAGSDTEIEFNQSGTDPIIPRGSTTGTPSGNGTIARSGNIATLTLNSDLDLTEANNVLIGTNVFRDSSSNNFGGTIAGDWNFTISAGASITAPSVGACVSQYTNLGDIVITENSTNNIVGTDNGSYTLVLGFDQSGFIFKPGTSGVTAVPAGGGDIQSITVNSVSFTQATFTIQFKDVSSDPQANNDADIITISGLKVSTDGSNPPPANIEVKAASSISIQGITEDATSMAVINGGSVPTAPTVTWPGNDNSYCSTTNLSTINITASGGTSYNWYNDSGLTSVLFTNQTTRTAAQIFGASPGVGVFTKYVTNVNGCESTATPVTLVITSQPVADAGNTQTICPGEPVSIGGAPTATGGSGSYTYSWTSAPAIGFSSTDSNPLFNAPPNASGANVNHTFTVQVTDGNGCGNSDNVTVTVKTVAELVVITQPNTFTYTTNNQPVNLVGKPAGGTFSGVGVIQLNGSYQFDPELATIGTWPITYTATLTNGCVKSVTQNFTVDVPYDIFTSLENEYCNNEGGVQLTISPSTVAQIQAYINTWNTVYVLNYGYSPLKPTFTGIVRNEYEYYYGDNNSVQPTGGTYVSGGVTLDRYNFYPTAFQTDQAYPVAGGAYGVCATCTYGYIAVFLEFANPLFTAPYNIPVGTDMGYAFNQGGIAALEYGGEFPYINPVPVVNFAGLLPSYCNVNTDYDLTGNKPGGAFEISNDGSTYGDIVGDGIKDVTEGIAPGAGEFNPQAAFGGASTATNKWIRYSVDPGKTGSTGQGCIGRQVRSTTIYPSTQISWDAAVPANNTQFCYEGAAVDLSTDQGIPPATGTLTFSGFGVSDKGDGSAKFTPQTAFDSKNPSSTVAETMTITAIYTNSQGCAYPINKDLIVRPKPVSAFTVTDPTIPGTPPDFNFCYNEPPLTLQGNQPASSTLQYFIDYISLGYTQNIASDDFVFNPATYYNDAVAKGGSNVSDANFNIRYVVTDAIGCTASATKLFAVSPLAQITISGIDDGDKFCSNEKPFPIAFAPINGTLRVNGISTGLDPLTNSINSVLLPIGNAVTINYEYKSGVSQCTTNALYTISKIAAPSADFSTTPICNEQVATFSADPDPNNYNWIWVLGDSVRSGTDKQTINHVFPGLSDGATQTSYLIKLIIENNPAALLVCRDSAEAIQVIGAYPKAGFGNTNVCEDDFTRFTINNDIPIATAAWDFGDGFTLPNNLINGNIPIGTHGGQTINKYGNPHHQFSYTAGQPNRFVVQLTARTAANVGACESIITRQVSILEKIAPTPSGPYFMADVNSGDGLWIEEDAADSTTWEFADPVGKFDNTIGKVWITNSSGPYKAKDNSYMNSPCFDLSAFTKPVFQLQYWNNTDLGKDGAILQYSINDGTTWQVLGTPTSGIDLYTNNTISSAPGGYSQYGWTGLLQSGWRFGKNSLDAIPGSRTNVRFRVAFSSDEREQHDGFAFGKVSIEERNRFILVEHFANTGASGNAASVDNFNNDVDMNSPEIVRLQYHTNFPSNDVINKESPDDNNARAAYYGVSTNTVPLGLIDGQRNGTLSFETPWFKPALDRRSLNSSPFALVVQTLPSTDPGEITVQVTATLVGTILNPIAKPILHVAIIEKLVGSNQFVLRKLLPHAAGTPLVTNPTIPPVTTETFTWSASNISDLNQIGVVSFIQDENTGEVYQAGILLNPTDPPTVITGTESMFGNQLSIYPNPAKSEVYIELPKSYSKTVPVKMIDSFGREVYSTTFNIGEQKKTVKTSEFASGVYIIQIKSTTGEVVRKKIVIAN
jgi:hypothetical protein